MNDTELATEKTEQLRHLIGTFMAEIMSADTDEMFRLLQREDLSMPRMVALNLVSKRGSVSITEISQFLDLSLGNTSMLVDKLVGKDLVTRAENEHDRRHKRVCLTAKGKAVVEELRATRVKSMVQRMLLLPPELQDRVIDVMSDVVSQLPPIGADSAMPKDGSHS
jgi:DNA-binding MarR family transcriptional regulator